MSSVFVIVAALWWVEPKPTSATEPAAASTSELIAALRHADSTVRMSAMETLVDRGPGVYDALREAFAASKTYDERRRIRAVVKRIYVEEGLGPPAPFLGIQLQQPDAADDPRLDKGTVGVGVAGVIPGTAADSAGLRAGDLIIRLNGDAFLRKAGANDASALSEWISKRKVGDDIEVQFYRGRRLMTVHTKLKRRPINVSPVASSEQAGKLQSRLTSFHGWWQQKFDPTGRLDPEVASTDDRAWRLEPVDEIPPSKSP